MSLCDISFFFFAHGIFLICQNVSIFLLSGLEKRGILWPLAQDGLLFKTGNEKNPYKLQIAL